MRLLSGLFAGILISSIALAQEREKDPAEMLVFEIEGMDLDRILKLISDELGVRFLYDEKLLRRKVYLLSPSKVARKDLLGLLVSILEIHNFTMVKAGPEDAEVWKVVPFTAPIANPGNKGRLPVVSLEELDRLPDTEELAMLVVTFKHADARGAFIAAQGMASDPRMVRAIESTNSVCLTDTAQNLRAIGAALRAMDVPRAVEGQPSVAVETALFDVRSSALEALGMRASGAKEGKTLDQVDPAALWSSLIAAAGSQDVQELHRWSGRILEGVRMQTAVRTDSFCVKLAMVAGLPKSRRPEMPVKEGETAAAPSPGPVEGEVSLNVNLDVSLTGDGGRVDSEDQTTLAGKEGTWLIWAIDTAAQDGTTRFFLARAAR